MGEVTRRPARTGLPLARPPGMPTPCWKCPKIPPGSPERTPLYAVELSERNRQAYLHYLECKAVGQWPDDPLVRRNARLIREAEDDQASRPLREITAMLRAFFAAKR